VKIPIANLYFLLAYTWDLTREVEKTGVSIGTQNIDFPLEMLVDVFLRSLSDQLRRGLIKEYKTYSESTGSPRGKIDLATSIKQHTQLQAQLVCEYTDLSRDVLPNQILKSTLARILKIQNLPKTLRQETITVLEKIHDISEIEVLPRHFHNIVIHRNNQSYQLLLNTARFILESLLPDEAGGKYKFVEFDKDRKERIFEGFVRNYLRRHLTSSKVWAPSMDWADTTGSDEWMHFLPKLKTDVVLDTKFERKVIEVKFYGRSLRTSFHSDSKKINSNHLYQLFSYMRNLDALDERSVSGVLLYAESDDDFDFTYSMHGHPIRIATLDLTQSPEEIGKRLLDIAA
jgi:5-methylcytosine-specific restriction enzyme subunit McrC